MRLKLRSIASCLCLLRLSQTTEVTFHDQAVLLGIRKTMHVILFHRTDILAKLNPLLALIKAQRLSLNHRSMYVDVTELIEGCSNYLQEAIGDQVVLTYPTSNINGSHFSYNVKGTRLSFGDIVALAGDYFFHWNPSATCAPTISQYWDTSPETSIALANETVNLLRTDWRDFLSCVLTGIHDQGKEIGDARSRGKDIAQVSTNGEIVDVSVDLCNRCTLILPLVTMCALERVP